VDGTTLRAELVHSLPMTITEQNDNVNGVDWRPTATRSS